MVILIGETQQDLARFAVVHSFRDLSQLYRALPVELCVRFIAIHIASFR
ncbi:MAG TPA: hypothetical protein VK479_00600 [Micropepsaceae bacterium]|nr:hypothetical protein [Micropepsaceae bacterium]